MKPTPAGRISISPESCPSCFVADAAILRSTGRASNPSVARLRLLAEREQRLALIVSTIGSLCAAIIVALGWDFHHNWGGLPTVFAIFVPGFLVYGGLVLKACGVRPSFDPYGTWGGATIVNAFWCVLLLKYPAGVQRSFYVTIVVCAGVSLLCSGLGLLHGGGEASISRGRLSTPGLISLSASRDRAGSERTGFALD